ncbi:MAG: hypothetical protein IJO14_00885 [Clostridia bacterium]|nr:hypothetical protein [Clostridia bacterium]
MKKRINKIIKQIKNNSSNKPKFKSLIISNLLYLIIFVAGCVLYICVNYFQNNTLKAIADLMLEASIFLTLVSNFYKYVIEKIKINIYCEEIINLSYVLFLELNKFLTIKGKETVEDVTNLEIDKYIENLNLHLDDRNYLVFDLILKKFSHICDMKNLKLRDSVVVIYEEITLAPSKEKNFNQIYLDLIKLLRCIKILYKKQNYLDELNRKIRESCNVLREENRFYYSEYIEQCLENNLAEKESGYMGE